MILTFFLIHAAQAALVPETYYLSNDAYLIIKKASEQQLSFELEGSNSYSGNSSSMAGTAVRKENFWEFRDKGNGDCVLRIKPGRENSLEVSLDKCPGTWLSEGVYKIRGKDCGSGFDKRNKEVGSLSRGKNFSEALKKAESLAKDCLETLDENGQGNLHSDLAFLAFKAGDKKRCRAEVKKGIETIGADRGPGELKEAFESYAEEDENGKKSCKLATKPGCSTYEERIKVFNRLDHNRKLCGSTEGP